MDTERLAPLILIVDDDPHLCRLLETVFNRAGYDAITALNGNVALATFKQGVPDLAIVDRYMPGMDGFELARQIKNRADVPIIMLTASHEQTAVIDAINTFAEDYVTKPFDHRELVARVQRVLRRFGEVPVQRGRELVLGPDSRISFGDRIAIVGDHSVTLTSTELRILSVLARNANRVVPSAALLQRVWDPSEEIDVETLRVHIRRIREKVEPDPKNPCYLLTDRGIGYRLAVQNAAETANTAQ
ncbi:MAG: response regulator transcription factor [Chloroflexi bacterium]|nr:response regulator transcription factor [Chloroflexota bacterium]